MSFRRRDGGIDPARYEQAIVWRSQVLPAMREGYEVLCLARDGCHDNTLERLKLEESIRSLRQAIRECERSLTVARKIVARVEKEKR